MTRRGSSLIEMLITITVLTAVLGVGIGTIAMLLRAESDGARGAVQTATLARFARDFRQDVNTAREALFVASTDRAELRLEGPGPRVIVYRESTEGLQEYHERDGQLEPRELYRFEQPAVSFAISDGALPLVSVSLDAPQVQVGRPRAASDDTSLRVTIEAALGRDARFQKQQMTSAMQDGEDAQ